MPEIARFFGIVIRIYCNDHIPPHFHAVYNEYEALFEIETLEIYRGYLPSRINGLVLEWATLHQQELMVNWIMAQKGKPVQPISPLV